MDYIMEVYPDGKFTRSYARTRYQSINLYTNYHITLGDNHNIAVLGGYQEEDNSYSYLKNSITGLYSTSTPNVGMGNGDRTVLDTRNGWATRGFFGRIIAYIFGSALGFFYLCGSITNKMKVAIIGGGAAGFFLAINLKSIAPQIDVVIFEKSSKVLAKVAVSGGGRCNLTNSFAEISDLSKAYPRGDKLLKKAFKIFNHQDAYKWFESKGIPLVTQDDACVFPLSQDSGSIIDCFLRLSRELGITIKTSHTLASLTNSEKYTLSFKEESVEEHTFDIVVITTGGNPSEEGFAYLKKLGHTIMPPVPSLFTFNIPGDPVRELMGTVAENASVALQGTKLKASGALLITHWGMSGPAILKLSSYAARVVSEKQYRFNILVNWVNETDCDKITDYLDCIIAQNPQKLLASVRPYDLSSRLWSFLLQKAGIPQERKWAELGTKGINKIMTVLSSDQYMVHGKGQFRDEFVTCGGVGLDSINPGTMESKHSKNLYFAGEVVDIDAITGGFNLQAAWTTAYLAAQAISKRIQEGRTEDIRL